MKKSTVYLILLIFLVISFLFYVATITGLFSNKGVENGKIYSNKEHGYSFIVPDGFKVKKFSSGDLEVREDGQDLATLEIRKFQYNEDESFEGNSLKRARDLCAADGVDITISCTSTEADQPFESRSSLPGRVLYFNEETQNKKTGESTSVGKGPFFIILLDENKHTFLVVHPPIAMPVGEVDSVVMRRVAETIEKI